MRKTRDDQRGFSAVEALLILVIVGLLGFVGWYVWHTNKKVDQLTESATQTTKIGNQKQSSLYTNKYLSIPEEGVKFQLNPELKDAYYFKSQQGYIYLSTHTLDNTKGAEGCAAKDIDGLGGGLVALIVGEVGQPNDVVAGDPWTQEQLDSSGLKKIGDKYYGFQHGNGPCYDVDNAAASKLANSTIQAFAKQRLTIVKE
jgi:hypothetical protein